MSKQQVWVVTRVNRDEPNPAVIAVGTTRAAAIAEAERIERAHILAFWRELACNDEGVQPETWRQDADREISVLADVLYYLLSHPDATEAYSPNDCRYIVEQAPFITI